MKLSSLISDGLVLQQSKDNYIWGSECEPGKEIKAALPCGIEGSDIADDIRTETEDFKPNM